MKVIFRIVRDLPVAERVEFASRIKDVWDNSKDLDCMICFGDDIEVYTVDDNSTIEIETY